MSHTLHEDVPSPDRQATAAQMEVQFQPQIAEILRATLSLVDYYAPPGKCAALCDLRRAMRAALAELEIAGK